MARIKYFDFLRGLAILMVVTCHTYTNEQFEFTQMFIRNLIGCPVPIFLAISGFFLAKKDVNEKNSYFTFLKRQIPKVYIPMILWSIPALLQDVKNAGFSIQQLAMWFTGGMAIYYFIAVIIQMYLLLPLFRKVSIAGAGIALLISLLSTSFTKYILTDPSYPLIIHAGSFTVWLVFFYVGIYLGRMSGRNYSLKPWLALGSVAILLMIIETYYLQSQGYGTPTGLKPSLLLYALAAVIILFSSKVERLFNPDTLFSRAVTSLGSSSFGIYLFHIYIAHFCIRVTHSNWIMSAALCLSISWALVTVCRKMFPKYAKYLGFEI